MKAAFLAIVFSLILTGCVPRLKVEDALKSKGEFQEGEVVAGFPNLPLYPDAKVIESYGDGGNFGATFTVNEELVKVVDFYKPALEGLGWEYTLNQRSETNYVFDFKNLDNQGQIIINTAENGKTTAISVFAEPR